MKVSDTTRNRLEMQGYTGLSDQGSGRIRTVAPLGPRSMRYLDIDRHLLWILSMDLGTGTFRFMGSGIFTSSL